MRLAVQLLLIEFPQCREPRVRQLELAVGAEHRDSPEQIFEGRALYRRQRAVGALEGVSIGDVLRHELKAAEGMRQDNMAQR